MSVEIMATYENIPTGSMQNSNTTGTYAKNYSSSFVDFNDFKTYRNVPKYATLEENRNLLDGTFINLPSNPVGYGYLSTLISDANGNFSNDIVITRTYNYNYSAPGLSFEFDTWTNEFPNSMNVKWYRGNTLLHDEDFNVDSANYFCDAQITAYNKVVITIGNMNKANRFLKIFNIADGITRQFYNEELENVEIIEQIANNNSALSINEANLRILPSNSTGVMFQRTLPFSIFRNEVLYGKFFIDSSTANVDKTLYSLKVNDYIRILEGQTYLGGIYSNITASNLIAEILGDIPYTLDADLGNKLISGYLPILNKREALRQVAFAINGIIDTTRSDNIIIKPFPTNVSSTLGKEKIIDIKTTQQNIVTKIILQTTILTTKNASTDNLFSERLNGTTTIIFDNPKFDLTISGGTIIASNINYAIISGTGSVVTLSGKGYQEAMKQESKVNEYAVTTDIEKVETYDTTLSCNDAIINNLNFVEYKIQSTFLMEDIKVGDLINLNGKVCRVLMLNYDLGQTNIYCKAEMEAYYE